MNRYFIEKEPEDPSALMANLQTVARASRTDISRNLLSTGLYAGQETVMELLKDGAELTPGQIADRLGVRPPTVTKTITRLSEQGFVDRRASDTDARQIHVALTDEGRAVLDAMNEAIRRSEKRALEGLKKKDRKHLAKILARIQENLTGKTQPGKTQPDKAQSEKAQSKSKKKSASGKKKKASRPEG